MGFKEDITEAASKFSGAYKKYSKKIVTIVIVLNVAFTIAMITLIVLGHEEPDTLIIEWFTFTGKELLALAGIKVADTASDTIVEVANKKKNDELAKEDTPNASDIEE